MTLNLTPKYSAGVVLSPTQGAPGSYLSLTQDSTSTLVITLLPLFKGEKGDQGDQGPAGDRGLQGERGDAGLAGASAYQLALASGFVGTQAEWLASLEGAPGSKGDQGDQGPAGSDAPRGVFVQSTPPASTGFPFLWIQTGLPNDGHSLWFDDGV